MTAPKPETVEPHRIVVTIDQQCVHTRFVCDGNETSPCYTHPGDTAPSRECWAQPWFDNGDPMVEYYDGPNNIELRSGPIDVWWDRDAIWWAYQEPAPQQSTVQALHDGFAAASYDLGASLDGDQIAALAVVADRLVVEALNEWQIGSWLDELADILKIEVPTPDGQVLTGIEQPVTPADVLAFVRAGMAEAVDTERRRHDPLISALRAWLAEVPERVRRNEADVSTGDSIWQNAGENSILREVADEFGPLLDALAPGGGSDG